jgi:hypothetical protein
MLTRRTFLGRTGAAVALLATLDVRALIAALAPGRDPAKLAIDAESVALLRRLFSWPQRWTSRPDPADGRRGYDVYLPGDEIRISFRDLAARLKVRRVADPDVTWARGALLGIYPVSSEEQRGYWYQRPTLVLYPLPHEIAPQVRLVWTDSHDPDPAVVVALPTGQIRRQ